jgi:sialidase-1
MKKNRLIILLGLLIGFGWVVSCARVIQEDNPFWGDGTEFFDLHEITQERRFWSNIVVATDGSLLVTWGHRSFQVRRSEDGGVTWFPTDTIATPGRQGGGTTVDENTGDILVFFEDEQPPAPMHVYRSRDHGKTWEEQDVVIHPDERGNIPSMHMNEKGLTLMFGAHAGRLIRPSRSYGQGNDPEFWDSHYTNAIYSDDGGDTWFTSAPFPVYGTGEAALAELSDGRIYYNSRRHRSTDGMNPRMRYTAWSYDGGETWVDVELSDVLPDGAQHTDYGLHAGLVRLPVDGHDILLYSNIDVPALPGDEEVPHHLRTTRRERGTIWASFDGGKTWPVKRLVTEGRFGYSSLAAGRAGTPTEGMIYLGYETLDDRVGYVARFNLPWLTEGRDWREYLPK